MNDERDRPRRARTHAGDDERANVGRHHRSTPRGGVPIEVDPELTPPPQAPPSPDSLDGYNSIPPPIQEQLKLLATGLGAATEAIGRVWDSRNDSEAFKRLEHASQAQSARIDKLISGIEQTHAVVDSFLMPAVKLMQGQLASLVSAHDQGRTRVTQFWDTEWPRAVKTLGEIGPRIDKVERMQEMQGFQIGALPTSINGLAGQFQGVTMLASELEKRLILLERDMVDRKAGQAAAALVDVDATARIAALEKFNNDGALVAKTNQRWSTAIAMLGSSALTLVITHVKEILGFFH